MRPAPDDYQRPADDLPLFPAHNGTTNSIEASARVAPAVSAQQARIVAAILYNGPMTRSELANYTGMKENSVNGRAFELCRDQPGHTPLLVGVGTRGGRELLDLTPAGVLVGRAA